MSHRFAQSTSLLQTAGLIFLGDMEKVDEKNAEFENIDNLKKCRISQCPISLLKVLLCYRLQTNFLR